MIRAPKRIWAFTDPDHEQLGEWGTTGPGWTVDGATEYVRADIHQGQIWFDDLRQADAEILHLTTERDELKHDLSRYIAIASEEATRAEALVAERDRWLDACVQRDAEILRLKGALDAAKNEAHQLRRALEWSEGIRANTYISEKPPKSEPPLNSEFVFEPYRWRPTIDTNAHQPEHIRERLDEVWRWFAENAAITPESFMVKWWYEADNNEGRDK